MKSKVLWVLAFASLLCSGLVQATPTLVGSTTSPTGIDGVVVDGVTYDVTFGTATPTSPWAAFSTGGADAAVALASAINGVGITTFCGTTNCAQQTIWVDGDRLGNAAGLSGNGFIAEQGNLSNLPWGLSNCDSFGGACTYNGSASFAAQSVPEAGTLALLGLGLAGMGVVRRRKAG